MRQPFQSAFGAINATSLLNWSFELRPEDLWQELTPVAISIDPEHCGYQHLQYPRGPERNNREHRRENPPRGKAAQREPLGSLGGTLSRPTPKGHVQGGDPSSLCADFGREHEPFLLLQRVRSERKGGECL